MSSHSADLSVLGRQVLLVSSTKQDNPANALPAQHFARVPLDNLDHGTLRDAAAVVFNVDLNDQGIVATLRGHLGGLNERPKAIFAVDRGSQLHFQRTQANALGAYDTVERPIDAVAV